MAWICVNEVGGAYIFDFKPIRDMGYPSKGNTTKRVGFWRLDTHGLHSKIWVTKKTAQQIVGFKMTWKDEPVKLK